MEKVMKSVTGRLTLCLIILTNVPQTTGTFVTQLTTSDNSKLISRRYRQPLFYQNEKSSSCYNIPVLGPFPNNPPMALGSEFLMNSPTPAQWATLEEALESFTSSSSSSTDQQTTSASTTKTATIDAAPLVAIIEENAADNSVGPRYATIAAVVSVMSSSLSETSTKHYSNEDFREYLLQVRDRDATIRLLGIGRAYLSDFFYQDRTEDQLMNVQTSSSSSSFDDSNDIPVGDMNSNADNPKIVMAKFQLIGDSLEQIDDTKFQSPVHAVSKLASLARKLEYMHDDRRDLYQQIQAAVARIELVSQEWEDWDGLGTLYSEVDEGYCDPFPISQQGQNDEGVTGTITEDDCFSTVAFTNSLPISKECQTMLELDQYGLSTLSTIKSFEQLTKELLEQMSPYYSPKTNESEEHYYYVYSFIALLSVRPILPKEKMMWALRCTNTYQRLQQVYEWMYDHERLLKELAEAKIQEMRDCGEECDIF